MPLTLQLNGHPRTFADLTDPTPLATLITTLDLKPDRVAIEHNGEIAPRTTWSDLNLHNEDRLEIVHFVGGGSQPY
ncbi:MAG: sulfur carrier protein ThiS [Acidobacteriota bacterium]